MHQYFSIRCFKLFYLVCRNWLREFDYVYQTIIMGLGKSQWLLVKDALFSRTRGKAAGAKPTEQDFLVHLFFVW